MPAKKFYLQQAHKEKFLPLTNRAGQIGAIQFW